VSSEAARPHQLPLLDGLRAVAALMVLGTHVAFETGTVTHGAWGSLLARLDFGVALFFVLSGFLLVRPWLRAGSDRSRPQPSTRTYLLRRAARILPAYWLVVLVALATTARGTAPVRALSNMALLQIYPGDLLSGLTQTWSLCTEVAFYLVLPVIAVTLGRLLPDKPERAVALVAALAVVGWVWPALAAGGALPARSSTWLPGHLDWFAAGLALALVERWVHAQPQSATARRVAELRRHPWTVLALAAAIFWLACTPVAGPATLTPAAPGTATLKELLYAACALLVLTAVAFAPQRDGALALLLGHPVARTVGRVSYGVFLWHLVILAGVLDLLGVPVFTGGFWQVLVLTVVGSLGAAAASWRLLERPVLDVAHRRPLSPPTAKAEVSQR